MYGYIYKVTCIYKDPRYFNKIYIGQKKSSRFNPNYKGSGTLIRGLRLMLGDANFKVELLYRCNNQAELDEQEELFIKKYNSRDPNIGYNQSIGGRENDRKTFENFGQRNDAEAVKLREKVKRQEEIISQNKKIKDVNNWFAIEKDGKTREVNKKYIEVYLKNGWKII